MCRFCIGMLTGVIVCLVCVVVAFKLVQGGTIGASVGGPGDNLEPLPELADPVPVTSETSSRDPTTADSPESQARTDEGPRARLLEPVAGAPLPPMPEKHVDAITVARHNLAEEPSAPPVPADLNAVPVLPEDPRSPEVVPPAPADVPPSAVPPDTPPTTPAPPPPTAPAEPASPPVVSEPTARVPIRPVPALRAVPVAAGSALLTGTYPCTVDENHQVKLSLTARGLLGEAPVLLVTPGPDGCLLICTPAGLPQLLEQLGQAMTEGTAHAVRRLYFAQTEKCVLDADGHFTISKDLAKFADLGRNAVLIGVGDYFELWDAGRWQKYLEQNAVGE